MRVVLDSNIWDQLAQDEEAQVRVAALTDSASLTIVVPATLRRELEAGPLGGVPCWFPVDLIPDGVVIAGHSYLGECRLGDAAVFKDHRGQSRQVADAIIVDTAHSYADVFVSEDRRARHRYAKISADSRSLRYLEFRTHVLGLPLGQNEEST